MADPPVSEPGPAGTPPAAVAGAPPTPRPAPPGTAPAAVGPSAPVTEAPPAPEARPRWRARSALVVLVLAWLAAGVAALAAVPDGFVVTRWWAYAFAFLALNTCWPP